MNNNHFNGGDNPQTPTMNGWDGNEEKVHAGSFLDETVTCTNTVYNQALVQSGQARDLNEAKQIQRNIQCNCGNCSTCESVGFLR